MKVLIAAGTGRYADPWHPFEATSDLVASLLRDAGAEASVSTDVDQALERLDGVGLLIVNAGDPWRNGASPSPAPEASVAGLEAALDRGIGVLALHASVSSLRDYSAWAPATGAVWVPTVSMHPPWGETRIHLRPHDLTRGLQDFDVTDERYCHLQMLGVSECVAEHRHDDQRFPTAWIRRHGPSRVACSLLGHDERSYDSSGNRELLLRLAAWAGRVAQ